MENQEAQMKFLQNLELEMYADMYTRMTSACTKKCISPKYRDPELTKGEAVCLDRCVTKYMDIHTKLGQKISEITVQDEAALQKLQSQMQTQAQSKK